MRPSADVLAAISSALPADGAAMVVAGSEDRALAEALAAARALPAAEARDVGAGRLDALGAATTVLVAGVLAAPGHGTVLAALRGSPGATVIAAVPNAGHADRRLAALDLSALPGEGGALPLAAAVDRLERAGFLVQSVARIRRGPTRRVDWLGGAAALEVGRLLARDPDATVDWYVVRAISSEAAAQMAAATARAEEAAARAAADVTREREVAAAAFAAQVHDARERAASLERELTADRAALATAREELAGAAGAGQRDSDIRAALELELEATRAALREQMARAERAEQALAVLEGTKALRAAQTVWRLKARARP